MRRRPADAEGVVPRAGFAPWPWRPADGPRALQLGARGEAEAPPRGDRVPAQLPALGHEVRVRPPDAARVVPRAGLKRGGRGRPDRPGHLQLGPSGELVLRAPPGRVPAELPGGRGERAALAGVAGAGRPRGAVRQPLLRAATRDVFLLYQLPPLERLGSAGAGEHPLVEGDFGWRAPLLSRRPRGPLPRRLPHRCLAAVAVLVVPDEEPVSATPIRDIVLVGDCV
mmetsp:Transcript_2080/g.6968  ORF Transcript_2080/g.6968 Transcript_2080/m.6968 type:complete len:226 (-) Transcript_2080:30-707(-)